MMNKIKFSNEFTYVENLMSQEAVFHRAEFRASKWKLASRMSILAILLIELVISRTLRRGIEGIFWLTPSSVRQ